MSAENRVTSTDQHLSASQPSSSPARATPAPLSEVAAAASIGYQYLAVALGGRDLGVFAGRPADVVACRDAVAPVLLAGGGRQR